MFEGGSLVLVMYIDIEFLVKVTFLIIPCTIFIFIEKTSYFSFINDMCSIQEKMEGRCQT